MTAHNGAQVFSLGNTIGIGSKLNWEQRLGFVRMGTFSDYKQTFAGGNLGVGAAQMQNLVANLMPGLELGNFANNDHVMRLAFTSARPECPAHSWIWATTRTA